jgi:hypothetical protein
MFPTSLVAFVRPGAGRQLLQFTEVEARRQGHDSIYLVASGKMIDDRALFARIGHVR